MTHPLVSVVMPAYNHEKYVGAAVESVLDQPLDDLELVVVDDGSPDQTAEVVLSYDDPRIRLRRQENQDAYNALNRGLSMARGRYLAIINSDDVYHGDRLARLTEIAQQDGLQCLFTDVEPVDAQGSVLGDDHPWRDWHERNRDFYLGCDNLYQGFLRGNYMVTTSNLFMSREVYEKVGEFAPIRYLHDYDYIFRILLSFEAETRYLADEKLLFYRVHGGNTLNEAAVTGREQDLDVIRRYTLARCPETKALINTGIDRLIELEHELIDVKRQLAARKADPAPPGQSLLKRMVRRVTG